MSLDIEPLRLVAHRRWEPTSRHVAWVDGTYRPTADVQVSIDDQTLTVTGLEQVRTSGSIERPLPQKEIGELRERLLDELDTRRASGELSKPEYDRHIRAFERWPRQRSEVERA